MVDDKDNNKFIEELDDKILHNRNRVNIEELRQFINNNASTIGTIVAQLHDDNKTTESQIVSILGQAINGFVNNQRFLVMCLYQFMLNEVFYHGNAKNYRIVKLLEQIIDLLELFEDEDSDID